MGLFVNPDCSAFKAAVASEIYIDKTSLIKHTNQILGTLQAFVCNSRPRRFGKSVTADMLTAYYSKGADASELFKVLLSAKTLASQDILINMMCSTSTYNGVLKNVAKLKLLFHT